MSDFFVLKDAPKPVRAWIWECGEPIELIKHLVAEDIDFSFYGLMSGDVELMVNPVGGCGDKLYMAERDVLVLFGDGHYEKMHEIPFYEKYRAAKEGEW